MAAVLTLTGTYNDLLTMVAFVSLLFNTLTVVALFVLRRRRPTCRGPYRAWGYPVLPALYILVSAFFLYFILVGRSAERRDRPRPRRRWALPAYAYWSRQRA